MPDRPGGSNSAGSFPSLEGDEAKREAVVRLLDDVHAKSHQHVVRYKTDTIAKVLGLWGLEPYPPTQHKLVCLGAVLKAGKYRSAESYVGIYKSESQRKGFEWDHLLQRTSKDVVRSCTRGLGGPVKALPLPFKRLKDLPGSIEPWVKLSLG